MYLVLQFFTGSATDCEEFPVSSVKTLTLPINRAEVVSAQKAASSLSKCRSVLVDKTTECPVAFYLNDGLLL